MDVRVRELLKVSAWEMAPIPLDEANDYLLGFPVQSLEGDGKNDLRGPWN